MTSNTEVGFGTLLADYFESTAAWRLSRAEVFPDDLRNQRCATALTAAAAHVRKLDEDETLGPLGGFWRFLDELNCWVRYGDATPVDVFGPDGPPDGRAASRFCFDNGTAEPTLRDFNRLIDDVFEEVLDDWRTGIEEGIDQPPGGLVELFAECGVPLWENEEEDAGDI